LVAERVKIEDTAGIVGLSQIVALGPFVAQAFVILGFVDPSFARCRQTNEP
jgi:hypothetical protein